MKKLALSVFGAIALSSIANAAIIYDFQGATNVGGGVFEYTYNARLQGDQKIDSTLGRNFSVLYDFAGFTGLYTIGNIAAGLSVVPVTEMVTTPQPTSQLVTDLANVTNLRAEITGTFNAAADAIIFTVVARSTGPATSLNKQSAQAVKDVPGDLSNNTLTGNTVNVEGPGSAAVPEPGTFALLGSSMLFAGVFARRFRK